MLITLLTSTPKPLISPENHQPHEQYYQGGDNLQFLASPGDSRSGTHQSAGFGPQGAPHPAPPKSRPSPSSLWHKNNTQETSL